MSCNPCAVAETLSACSNSIVIGTATPATDYFIYLKNETTGHLQQFEVTSDGAGLITWDTTDLAFATKLPYTLWITLTTSSVKEEITVGVNTFTCLSLSFTQIFDNDRCCVCIAEQTVEIVTSGQVSGDCICVTQEMWDGISGGYTDQTTPNGVLGLLAGAVDGLNTTFTVSQGTYTSGKLKVYWQGQRLANGTALQYPLGYQETDAANGIFDMNTAPTLGDVIIVDY